MALQEICNKHGVSLAEIKGNRRFENLVNARKDICIILWKVGYYQDEIADFLNISQPRVSQLISAN